MAIERRRVYISGPITLGDQEHNFEQAAEAQMDLMQAGFAPLNPMLSMRMPGAWTLAHHVWIECDLPWVDVADYVLRLRGESVGADAECLRATRRGIPVFYSLKELIEHDTQLRRAAATADNLLAS